MPETVRQGYDTADRKAELKRLYIQFLPGTQFGVDDLIDVAGADEISVI